MVSCLPTRFYYFFQRRTTIITLDPNKFAEKKQQPIHLANFNSFKALIVLHNQSRPVLSTRLFYHPASIMGTFLPYPPDIKPFLYYFTLPEKSRISGELRLRVIPRDDPASFESGYDLLGYNGSPWSRPLCALRRRYIPLYEKLREEKLVSDELDSLISTFPTSLFRQYHRGRELYSINDTFIVDFSKRDLKFTVITEQDVETLLLTKQFHDNRIEMGGRNPYTGRYTNHHLD